MGKKASQTAREIPFSRPSITDKEVEAVVETLRGGWLTMASRVEAFEEGFRKYVGSEYAIAVSSCTAALHLSLAALGVGKGTEVLTTPFTFAATANVIVHQGGRPVFVDIEPDAMNIDPRLIEEKLTGRSAAILPVHYGGVPCEMSAITRIADDHALPIVEDCAHSLGAFSGGRHTGTLGSTGCFSFYPTKNITTAEGGMVVTDDASIDDAVRTLRLHGMTRGAWRRYQGGGSWKYDVVRAGYKYNMSDLQAALGVVQLQRLAWMNRRREELAKRYLENLKDIEGIVLPVASEGRCWHLFPIRVDPDYRTRDEVVERLAARGVGTSVHFIPLHLQSFYQSEFGYRTGDFPVAERAFETILSLPLYPDLAEEDLDYVCATVREAVRPGA